MFCSSFKLSFLQNTEESDRSEEEDLAQGLLQNTKIQAAFECGKAEQELGEKLDKASLQSAWGSIQCLGGGEFHHIYRQLSHFRSCFL